MIKDKKGAENNMLVVGLLAFVAIIVGIALLQASAGFVGQTSTTYVYNSSLPSGVEASAGYTPPAASACAYITGQNLLSTPTVVNRTGAEAGADCATNFTFTDEAVNPSSGVQQIKICTNALWITQACSKLNITYTYGPSGYIASSGGRSIASLILIFFGLAIAIAALIPSFRSGIVDLFNR